jgi:glutaredoxin
MQKVDGQKRKHKVTLFALSTCMWCKKMKKLLQDESVEYEFVDVDSLQGAEHETIIDEVKKYNPRCTFPTIIIDGKCIVGYNVSEIRKALGL